MTDNRPNARKITEFNGHAESIYSLAAMEDGMGIYSAGSDGLVVEWMVDHNPESAGKVVARVSGSVYALCFLSARKLLLVGQNQSGIHQIDLKTHNYKLAALPNVTIFAIAEGPVDDLVYVGLNTGELVCLDSMTMEIRQKFPISHQSIRTLAFHPNGQELAIGSSDHYIRIFRIDDREPKLIYGWKAHHNSVFSLSYSPEGNTLLSTGRDATVKRWDTSRGYTSAGSVNAHIHAINQVIFSPDGKHFLTCSMDKTIKIWSSDELQLLRVLDHTRHGGHMNSVNRLTWLSNERFASAGDDRRVILWQMIYN